jgi:GDP-L-fucose synthase
MNCDFKFEYDKSKPDGQSNRVVNTEKIRAFGWSPKISLSDGVERTIQWFVSNQDIIRRI